MNQRTAQREATRERVLEAARLRFEEHGFEAVQLRDVADDAGVAVGTIFVHFTDKHDLLCAALFDELTASVERAATVEADDFAAWLDQVTAGHLAHYTARPKLARVLLREALLAPSPWRERFAALIARIGDAVIARLERERDAGRLTAIDPRVFAGAYISFFTFALIAWVQETHPVPRRLVDVMVRQHLRGVLP